MFECISQKTDIALYADDTKIWSKIKTSEDHFVIQSDINQLFAWSNRNKMKFHPSKSKVLSITNQQNILHNLPFTIFQYRLDLTYIDYVSSYVDLGVTINNKLLWKEQCDNHKLVCKGNSQLGMLIERNTDKCFLVTCPGNKRDAASATLIPIIKEFIQPGTTILTDMWKYYINRDSHGYIHHDVNHSRSFVDPSTGAHTNTIEGKWTHAKHKAQRRGGGRTEESLKLDLTEFMRRKRKGVTRGDDRSRKMFSREIPLLLNYRRYLPN